MSKKKKKKKAVPGWTHNGVVMSWCLGDDRQQVPAIEQSRITVIKCPVDYYQHFDYSPEVMALRREDIIKLGWSGTSFDLPRPPFSVGEFSLLSRAIKKIRSVLNCSHVDICYPSTILFYQQGYKGRSDFCLLYFNHEAYEFYNLLFIIAQKNPVPFENVPKPEINTLNQLLRWSTSFESMRRRLYKEHGFTWEPQGSEKKEAELKI